MGSCMYSLKVRLLSLATLLAFCTTFLGFPPPVRAVSASSAGKMHVFNLMIVLSEDNGISRAQGGQVAVSVEGADPSVHPIDANGITSFEIPDGKTTRATFSGEFVSYTLRFEFADGLMQVYNDALPAEQQEAKLPYYLNMDGTYAVEYRQDYLYMLAPSEPGGYVIGSFMARQETAPADQAGTAPVPNYYYPPVWFPPLIIIPQVDPARPCHAYRLFDLMNYIWSPVYVFYLYAAVITYMITVLSICPLCLPLNAAPLAGEEGEVPTLEISLTGPDGTQAFSEWVQVGGSGVLGEGFQWSADLDLVHDSPQVIISQTLTPEFIEALPPGRSTLTYRLFNSQETGSNFRIVYLDK